MSNKCQLKTGTILGVLYAGCYLILITHQGDLLFSLTDQETKSHICKEPQRCQWQNGGSNCPWSNINNQAIKTTQYYLPRKQKAKVPFPPHPQKSTKKQRSITDDTKEWQCMFFLTIIIIRYRENTELYFILYFHLDGREISI